MPSMIDRIKLAGINNAKYSLVFALLFLVVATAGVHKLKFTTDYRYFFGEDNPERLDFNEFQSRFGKTDNIFIVVKPIGKQIFNARTLEVIDTISTAGWNIPYANRVDSITNFTMVRSENDEIESIRLADLYDLSSDEGINRAKLEITKQDELKDILYTADLSHAAVNINVYLPDVSVEKAQIEAVSHVRELLSVWRKQFPDHEFYLSGQLIMAYGFFEAAFNDSLTLIPLMYFIMIVILWVLLRSFYAMLVTLIVVFCSAAAGIGLASWLGITLSTMSASAPLIILTVAVADCVHIIISTNHASDAEQERESKAGSITRSLELNFTPVLITTVTTVIGFLSLNFNEMPPARDLGNIVALGVVCAFIFSLQYYFGYSRSPNLRRTRYPDQ
ncbi:MAG: hypothetical protein COB51_08080 [Moraxellaceae bacterium]|nr:MAG: hypothetical protein COB51_08080 [Moraxellaceae bacterium]